MRAAPGPCNGPLVQHLRALPCPPPAGSGGPGSTVTRVAQTSILPCRSRPAKRAEGIAQPEPSAPPMTRALSWRGGATGRRTCASRYFARCTCMAWKPAWCAGRGTPVRKAHGSPSALNRARRRGGLLISHHNGHEIAQARRGFARPLAPWGLGSCCLGGLCFTNQKVLCRQDVLSSFAADAISCSHSRTWAFPRDAAASPWARLLWGKQAKPDAALLKAWGSATGLCLVVLPAGRSARRLSRAGPMDLPTSQMRCTAARHCSDCLPAQAAGWRAASRAGLTTSAAPPRTRPRALGRNGQPPRAYRRPGGRQGARRSGQGRPEAALPHRCVSEVKDQCPLILSRLPSAK